MTFCNPSYFFRNLICDGKFLTVPMCLGPGIEQKGLNIIGKFVGMWECLS